MRNGLVFSVGLLALIVAGGGAAVAADLPLKAPPPMAPPVSDWTGFYVGIHGGGGWGHTSFDPAFTSNSALLLAVAPPNANPTGGVFGGQVGYNWQWGSVVGGLELDFSGADINQSSSFAHVPTGRASPIAGTLVFCLLRPRRDT
jgi:outer membrane immunogenic protein